MEDDSGRIQEELDEVSSKIRARERAAVHLDEAYAELDFLKRGA